MSLNYTTTEVCEKYLKPITSRTQSSYCEYLLALSSQVSSYSSLAGSLSPSQAAYGVMPNSLQSPNHHQDSHSLIQNSILEANVFISHAWAFKFLDVIDTLMQHFENEKDDVILWFDLFSNNQHKAVDLDFNYWATTFKSAIQQFGRTVMVLSPWNNPIPLTRAWCLWELYCTATTQSRFEIAMTHESRQEFIKDILINPQGEINKMLGTISLEQSQCYFAADRERIFQVVRSTVGFSKLNSLVFERLRNWVIEVMQRELTIIEEKLEEKLRANETMEIINELRVTTGRYQNSLAGLYSHQGKIDESIKLYQDCYQKYKEILGSDHPDTVALANVIFPTRKISGE